jgi:hypothetical protein
VIGIICVAILIPVGGSLLLRLVFFDDYSRFESIEPGMTRARVIELLGTPLAEYSKEDAPSDYTVPGYDSKKRPISGSVLVYQGVYTVAYVYLSERGMVEEVFIGGG